MAFFGTIKAPVSLMSSVGKYSGTHQNLSLRIALQGAQRLSWFRTEGLTICSGRQEQPNSPLLESQAWQWECQAKAEVWSMKYEITSPTRGRGLNIAHNESFFAHAWARHVPIFFHHSSFILIDFFCQSSDTSTLQIGGSYS